MSDAVDDGWRFHPMHEDHEPVPGHPVWCVTLGEPAADREDREEAYRQFYFAASVLLNLEEHTSAEEQDVDHDRANPTCFLLRHAIELALKIVVPGIGHGLSARLDRVATAAAEDDVVLSEKFIAMVRDIDATDGDGEGFRYAAENTATCCANPRQLRRDLEVLQDAVLLDLARVAPRPRWNQPYVRDWPLVARVVKAETARRGLTIDQMAKKAGKDRSFVANMARGERASTTVLYAYEGALDLPRGLLALVARGDLAAIRHTGAEPDLIRWIGTQLGEVTSGA